MDFVGRKEETKLLKKIYESNKPEFVAVYGRRRVGKTYLVDEVFKEHITFKHTALPPSKLNGEKNNLKNQLKAFHLSMCLFGYNGNVIPKTWLDAFYNLIVFLKTKINNDKVVVFIDELPWLDTPKSNFIEAFTWFWNNWASKQPNLKLIVCGSSNSWIMDELINSHSGLYDRITCSIKLVPFTLYETEEFLLKNGVKLSRYNIAQLYMMLGGIPYYLNYYDNALPLAINIDNIFFGERAKLKMEYDNLFDSTFDNGKLCQRINDLIIGKHKGLTRNEIASTLKISAGGDLSKSLKALEDSGFIVKYYPYLEKKEYYYKAVDQFSIFYLKFVKNNEQNSRFLEQNSLSQAFASWRGYAFENVCFTHIDKIVKALRIDGIKSSSFSWVVQDENTRSQIDMVIERKDNVVSLCEMKFVNDVFSINKKYHDVIINRTNILKKQLNTKQSINHVLITTFGLKQTEYSDDFLNVITLNELF